jgi:tRNA (guanine37-N1)-methyltransferase
MRIDIITLFPDMFKGPFDMSMIWKAKEKGLVEINFIDLREYGLGPRRQVDDTPYGGGDGMVLRVEPIFAAVEAAKQANPGASVAIMTPRGQRYNQPLAKELSASRGLIILAGHYEGFDERIMALADYQLSIGDYVLTGGELPAMVVVDSIVRLLPGVLGGELSAQDESFADGLLEYPHYTRPEEFRGMRVPEVLLSGHHAEIERWRRDQAREITKKDRPDLIKD